MFIEAFESRTYLYGSVGARARHRQVSGLHPFASFARSAKRSVSKTNDTKLSSEERGCIMPQRTVEDEDLPLLTSVEVVCRQVPGVAAESHVIRLIEQCIDCQVFLLTEAELLTPTDEAHRSLKDKGENVVALD
jgi:hypothetical protein